MLLFCSCNTVHVCILIRAATILPSQLWALLLQALSNFCNGFCVLTIFFILFYRRMCHLYWILILRISGNLTAAQDLIGYAFT